MTKSQPEPESTSDAPSETPEADETATSAGTSKTTASTSAASKSTASKKAETAGTTKTASKKSGNPATKAAAKADKGKTRKSKENIERIGKRPPILTVRFVLMIALIVAGIVYITMTYRSLGPNPPEEWFGYLDGEAPRRWVWELDHWNYAIGFGAILIGLMVGAHRSTPLGRGNGVVVGMLGCFVIGLLWICTFYIFSNNLNDIWVFGALGQLNLVVGIAFMAVGFSYATKWE
ncbi:cell division protein CrgA [Nocardioides alkalitolerans]|uniref:cell division protein CrgA n=1 Tax=Nocardioides alkalitolerans TaxID=281714 RepID=UPI00040CEECB|nr:cell division protein CrgA [Nocardioides alkalitolerans]